MNQLTDEDKLLKAWFSDLLEKAQKGIPTRTHFLTPHELSLAQMWAHEMGVEAFTAYDGGCQNAERKIMYLLPDYMQYAESALSDIWDSDDLIVPLHIEGSGFLTLTHRDYLGSILGLGVDRSVMGDIAVLGPYEAVAFCETHMADFLQQELKMIGHDAVKIKRCKLPADFEIPLHFEIKYDTVASLRLDCLVASVTGLSREKSKALILQGNASINTWSCEEPDYQVEFPATLSVRGYGKYRFTDAPVMTKKGHLRIKIEKYM